MDTANNARTKNGTQEVQGPGTPYPAMLIMGLVPGCASCQINMGMVFSSIECGSGGTNKFPGNVITDDIEQLYSNAAGMCINTTSATPDIYFYDSEQNPLATFLPGDGVPAGLALNFFGRWSYGRQ